MKKIIKDSADIENLPEEIDKKETEKINKTRNAAVKDDKVADEPDEVLEDEAEKVPGYDLGRNKVQ